MRPFSCEVRRAVLPRHAAACDGGPLFAITSERGGSEKFSAVEVTGTYLVFRYFMGVSRKLSKHIKLANGNFIGWRCRSNGSFSKLGEVCLERRSMGLHTFTKV